MRNENAIGASARSTRAAPANANAKSGMCRSRDRRAVDELRNGHDLFLPRQRAARNDSTRKNRERLWMAFFLSASSRPAISFCNLEKRHGGCRTWAGLAVPAAAVETPAYAVTETATKTHMHKAGASEPRMEEARVTKAAICALVSRGQSADVSPPRLRRCQGKRERSLKRENGTAPGAPHCEAPTSLRSPASRDRKFVRLSAGGKWIRTSESRERTSL
jgi:hypothetical protein